MSDLDKLRDDYQAAEKAAHDLQAEKDDALQKTRNRYTIRLHKAVDKAAAAQKKLNDAEAARALTERDDLDDEQRAALADTLGLKL